jgi:hypothetical protein
MCYFKQVYERGKLDTKYANPPLSWSTEMQQPKFEDADTFNLLDRFYHTPVETSRGKFFSITASNCDVKLLALDQHMLVL